MHFNLAKLSASIAPVFYRKLAAEISQAITNKTPLPRKYT